MEAQIYFEEILKESSVLYAKMEEYKSKYPEFFSNFSKETISTLSDERLTEFFKISQIINDNQILFNKIASYIDFCKKIEIDLDMSKLPDINGLTKFISNFSPFETDFIVTSDENIEIKNKKENEIKFKSFKDNLLNILKIGMTDES